uniref:OSJNBa0033H08.5 protein n=1 Tax=Oryza sativa subsp. japonica TaxID=39947 RepID=Q7XXL1_ORYSJ|nr:OSJNBa0033H08.5 [Oryza sativa Japonica Group]
MGAAVAGEPRHKYANGGHREKEREATVLTNTYATTDGNGRWPATSLEGRRGTGQRRGAVSAIFSGGKPVAGLHLDDTFPEVATAQSGEDRGDGEVRMDQRPAAVKLGFTSARYFQRSSASGKWRPVFFSSSRTQRRQRRPKATTTATARGCWSGGRR